MYINANVYKIRTQARANTYINTFARLVTYVIIHMSDDDHVDI